MVKDWTLVGKLALAPQVEILPTVDLDFLVAFLDFEGLEKRLRFLSFKVAVVDLSGGKRLLRFWKEEDLIPVDLIEAKFPWEHLVIRDSLVLEVFERLVKVARKEDILVIYYRDFKDRTDLELLLKASDLDEERVEFLAKQAGVLEKWNILKKKRSS